MKIFIKATILFILFFQSSNLLCFGQCNVDELMPFRNISSKFELQKYLMLNGKYYDIENKLNQHCYLSLPKDAEIKYSSISAKLNDPKCLGGSNSTLCVSYADNKLYHISIRTHFSATEFNECYEKYETLLSSISKDFPYKEPFRYGDEKDPTGEGFNCKKSQQDDNDLWLNYFSVSYRIDYKWIFPDDLKTPAIRSSEIEEYVLEIEFLDLNDY